ncbi:MAG: glycosyltransferase [Bacteroidota bacterium]
MTKFAHFILTVFNVRLSHGGETSPDSAWLEHRFRLFEEFCYPSVRAQTTSDFTWLAFFDTSTPPEYKDRIAQLAKWKPFVPCFVSEVMSVESFAGMKKSLLFPRVSPGTTHLISTNLDNDDALHARYVETVQKEFSGQDFEFVNFTNGYVFDRERERLYLRSHHSNPFASLLERLENSKTVWCAPHPEFSRIGPVRQVETEPMWFQVVHGRNVSNSTAEARRVSLDSIGHGFDAVKIIPRRRESRSSLALENVAIRTRAVLSRITGRQ